MSTEVVIIGALAFIQGLFVLYVETRLKKSIEHKFDVKLEEMKQEFSRAMADRERKDKYRLVALEQRLATYQRAYSLTQNLLSSLMGMKMPSERAKKIGMECLHFWEDNNLYFDTETRKAFFDATAACLDWILGGEEDCRNEDARTNALKNIGEKASRLSRMLVEAVDLEAFANEGQDFSTLKEKTLVHQNQ